MKLSQAISIKEKRPIDRQGRIICPAEMRRRLNLPLSILSVVYDREDKEVVFRPKEAVSSQELNIKEDLSEIHLTLPDKFLLDEGLKPKDWVLVQYYSCLKKIRITKAPPFCSICGTVWNTGTPEVREIPASRGSGAFYVCRGCAQKIQQAFLSPSSVPETEPPL